eukprot:355647-Chlamydomonas_euryale.AAC.7
MPDATHATMIAPQLAPASCVDSRITPMSASCVTTPRCHGKRKPPPEKPKPRRPSRSASSAGCGRPEW